MPGAKAPEDERREQILEAAHRVASLETLRGLTIRGVAEEAGLSNGLVLFHFKTKELLLLALLDRLLAHALEESRAAAANAADPAPREAFRELLRLEIARLPQERERVELFFDFWVVGTRQPEIRTRVRVMLEHYRTLLAGFTASLIESDSRAFAGMTADGLAAVAVSFIEGCALQAVIDPASFDVGAYLDNVDALLDALSGGRQSDCADGGVH